MPTDVLNLRAQQAVLSSLAAQERFDVVVKEHPSVLDSHLEDWCEARLPGRVRFLYGPTFARLVHLADAVVVDYPSTSLLQALFGRARILVTDDPISEWEPGVREHLSAYGVLFVPPEAVGDPLPGLELREAPYPPEALEPLLAAGPDTAATRAADAVLEIASG